MASPGRRVLRNGSRCTNEGPGMMFMGDQGYWTFPLEFDNTSYSMSSCNVGNEQTHLTAIPAGGRESAGLSS